MAWSRGGSHPSSVDRGRIGHSWQLLIYCGQGAFNWDVFIFYPDGNYEGVGPRWGGTGERSGAWMYVHE